ncbi:glycosyltransferase family 1 protein [Bifidobacterium gallicum]|nr:glycosyltransferase family 1 protein [Bifidobacterium gallicum]
MTAGGVESVVLNNYRNIDRERFRFDFIAQENSTVVPQEEIEDLGGRVLYVPSYSSPHAYMRGLRDLFTTEQPDIVHSNVNALSVFPLYAAKQAHVAVRIAHSHSTDNRQEHFKSAMKSVLRPLSHIYPTDFATCSWKSGEWLFGKKLMNSGKVKMLPNAIDVQRFQFNESVRQRKRKELGVDDALVVGQVGRLCFQKNQMFSLRIFAELLKIEPSAVLLFAGVGDDEAQLRQEARRLGIDHAVRFLGMRTDVDELEQAFDVVLMPSQYEGLPLSAVEAQAAGCPVVLSTEVTSETSIIPALMTFLPLSAPAGKWAQALHQAVMRNQNHRESRIQQFYESGYDVRDSGKRLGDWYLQLLHERNRR